MQRPIPSTLQLSITHNFTLEFYYNAYHLNLFLDLFFEFEFCPIFFEFIMK